MALCNSCDDILRDSTWSFLNTEKTIHSTRRSFLAAVDEGCYICKGLFRQVPEEWKQELRRHVETSKSSPSERLHLYASKEPLTSYKRGGAYDTRYGLIELNLQVIGPKVTASSIKAQMPRQICLHVYPVAAKPFPWTVTSHSTNSEETFTKIKDWLRQCEKTHTKCHLRRDEADVGWHPTRLVEIALDLENGGNANNLRCRLVEPKSGDSLQNPRYITLSHRWPQEEFQRLTVANLPLWKNSLPVKLLRKTFRDAFFVAQRLGISYVWIDSLCIIQHGDSYEDWQKESPMMQKVYSNAEFNICASKKDQNDGLFSSRQPSSPQAFHLDLTGPEDDDDRRYIDSGHYLIRSEGTREMAQTWEANLNDSPLASRGWVFQERLLSRANIHFSDHEVLYECLEMRASEYLGADRDYEIYWDPSRYFFKEHLPIPTVVGKGSVSSNESTGVDLDHDHYQLWHDLLSRYTPLELTESDDRLVALSGVAQHLKKYLSHDDCYIAGLWRSRLATEILWKLTDEKRRESYEKRKKRSRHLSFSWASVEGRVEGLALGCSRSEPIDHLADLEVINYRTSAKDKEQPFVEDILSLPSTAKIEIRLRGFLRPMVLAQSITTTWWIIRVGTEECKASDLNLFPSLSGPTILDFEISSSEELNALNTSGRLFFMPLVAIGGVSVWLLLLELVETSDGKDMGRFRRIGVLEDGFDLSPSEWLTKNMSLDDSFSKLQCGQYDDISKQHTIFVI